VGRRNEGAQRPSGIAGRPVKRATADYVDEEVIVGGVHAVRRRKAQIAREARELYLHLPMASITALGRASIPAAAWPLALWVLWHQIVAKRPASITAEFASRAGIFERAARRYAVDALATSGLFHVTRSGTRATKISPNAVLEAVARPRARGQVADK
jgi:hypothetical protein